MRVPEESTCVHCGHYNAPEKNSIFEPVTCRNCHEPVRGNSRAYTKLRELEGR